MSIGSESMDQMYNLRGLNMIKNDQTIDDDKTTYGQSPFTINSRLLAPQTDSDPRTAVQSRSGAGFYTIPAGETLDTQYTTTTGQSDGNTSNLLRWAQRFTPGVNNRALSAIDILIKNGLSNDNIIIDIYEDVSGVFGTQIATTSLSRGQIADTYGYVKARFAQGAILLTSKNYWIVIYGQEEIITSNYLLARNTSGANLKTSTDAGTTWVSATGGINFKTYLSDPGAVKGQHRFVSKTGVKQTLFAHGTSIYQVTNESTGAIVAIKTGLSSSSTRVRFRTVYDKVFIVNGIDAMMKWDGTTLTTSTHTTLFPVPDNVIIYHDRAWYYSKSDPTRLYFSEIYPDLEIIDSVNFQYVPDTSSPDPITGLVPFQNQLVIFTRDSKYLLLGDDVSTLGLSQSPGGTKGAVSQESIAMGEKVVYFVSIDGGAYYYDGAQDIGLSDNVQPEMSNLLDADPDSIDSVVVDKGWRIYYKRLGDTQHTRMLLLDLRFNEWLIDTDTYTRLGDAWTLEDNTLTEASSTIGAIYFGEAQESQLGAPIQFKYWTNYKKYTSGIAKDRVRTFRAIFASPDKTIDVLVGKDADFDNDARYKTVLLTSSGILYDGGETYGSATAIYGRGTRVSQPRIALSGRANNTQYRFEKDVINTSVRLYGYEAIIKSGKAR